MSNNTIRINLDHFIAQLSKEINNALSNNPNPSIYLKNGKYKAIKLAINHFHKKYKFRGQKTIKREDIMLIPWESKKEVEEDKYTQYVQGAGFVVQTYNNLVLEKNSYSYDLDVLENSMMDVDEYVNTLLDRADNENEEEDNDNNDDKEKNEVTGLDEDKEKELAETVDDLFDNKSADDIRVERLNKNNKVEKTLDESIGEHYLEYLGLDGDGDESDELTLGDLYEQTYGESMVESEEKVDHPKHYNQLGTETIEFARLLLGDTAVAHFCLVNALKYRERASFKGNFGEDVEKAEWYINKYKELTNKKGNVLKINSIKCLEEDSDK